VIRKIITVLLLVATLLGLYNVYADNSLVQKLAEQTACGNAGCVRTLRAHRTPMGQDFEFQTSVQPQRSLEVHCARSFVLLGEYRCESRSAR
jgi:hypothetical protein